jgi:serine/threonine-protein kinase
VTARIVSHYAIERSLGAGGMGEVFLARDLALGRPVALKLLTGAVGPASLERFRREAAASARVQHPAIATFYEAGDDGGVAFLAMEFVPGETLRSRLARGPLDVAAVLALADALLEGLTHAHAAACCIGTSSPRTSWSATTAARSCSTSGSRG